MSSKVSLNSRHGNVSVADMICTTPVAVAAAVVPFDAPHVLVNDEIDFHRRDTAVGQQLLMPVDGLAVGGEHLRDQARVGATGRVVRIWRLAGDHYVRIGLHRANLESHVRDVDAAWTVIGSVRQLS